MLSRLRRPRRSPAPFRPGLELLETRLTPAVTAFPTPITFTSSGPNPLEVTLMSNNFPAGDTVTGITITGPNAGDFSAPPGPFAVSPIVPIFLPVTFTGSGNVNEFATLDIASAGNPDVLVPLQFLLGLKATTPLNFGTYVLGSGPFPTLTSTITNLGGSPVATITPMLFENGSGDLAITYTIAGATVTPPFTLNPGKSVLVTVTFQPTQPETLGFASSTTEAILAFIDPSNEDVDIGLIGTAVLPTTTSPVVVSITTQPGTISPGLVATALAPVSTSVAPAVTPAALSNHSPSNFEAGLVVSALTAAVRTAAVDDPSGLSTSLADSSAAFALQTQSLQRNSFLFRPLDPPVQDQPGFEPHVLRSPDLNVFQELDRIVHSGERLNFDGQIAGLVFEDQDLNGKLEGDKGPLRNELVYIDLNGDGFQRNNPVVVTDNRGHFSFHGLPPGDYVVRLVPRPFMVQSRPTRDGMKVKITEEKPVVDNANFGAAEVRRRRNGNAAIDPKAPPSAWARVLELLGVVTVSAAPADGEASEPST